MGLTSRKPDKSTKLTDMTIETELLIYRTITEHYAAGIAAVSLVFILGAVSLYLAGPATNKDNK